jgi:tetratricopeptide (TPR) repeat protein
MSGPAREQVRERFSALELRIDNPDTAVTELGDAYGGMGQLFLATRYFEAAESCFLNAQTLAPDDVRWPYYLGHVYRSLSDSKRAAASFERAIELRPTDVAALVYLGDEYISLGRPEAAEPPLEKAVALEPRLAVALFALGRAALAKQDYASAVPYIEKALTLEPQASTARYALAMAYRGVGEPAKAEAYLRERGDVGFQFLPDALMQEVRELVAGPETYYARGAAAFDRGEWAAAAAAFRKGLELAPHNSSLRLKLAEALRRNGPVEESLLHYELALKRSAAPVPLAAEARFGYAMALVRLRRYQEARDRLIEGTKVYPDRPAFAHALVRLLAAAPDDRVRDGRRALTTTRELLQQQELPDLYETMAMALAEVGQFEEAAAVQRELIDTATRARFHDVVPRLVGNLQLYEAGKPCRTPWRDADIP